MGIWVKVCGITNEEDALLSIALGADALGFIFATSPRHIRQTDAADIVKRLPGDVLTVGVFKDDTPERIVHTIRATGLQAAQVHGSYRPEDVAEIRRGVPKVLCAFGPGDPRVREAHDYDPWAVLLDSARPGSGTTWDWTQDVELPLGVRLVAAGGLSPTNVAEAMRTLRPWGVDVNSGVESAPGRKDPIKLKDFLREARAAGQSLRAPRPTPAATTGPSRVFDWQDDGLA